MNRLVDNCLPVERALPVEELEVERADGLAIDLPGDRCLHCHCGGCFKEYKCVGYCKQVNNGLNHLPWFHGWVWTAVGEDVESEALRRAGKHLAPR